MLFTPSEASVTSLKSHSKRRHAWPLGIRAQVALWTSMVFVLLLLLFGTLFYMQLRATLNHNIDTSLLVRAQHITSGLNYKKKMEQQANGQSPIYEQWQEHKNKAIEMMRLQPNLAVDMEGPVRIIGPDNTEVYSSPTFQVLKLPDAIEQNTSKGKAWIGTVSARDGQEVRLYSLPLIDHGSVYGLVQVGTSLAALDATLNNVIYELVLLGPLVLLLGGFGSYLLACKAFQPIGRLTSAARTIAVGDLTQRVPVPRAQDEVQRLALTFNEMLASLDAMFARQRRFTADAAHELRTPVAAIRSLAEVALSERSEPEMYMHVLQNITSESERLGELIRDLLVLARADEGQASFEHEPVRLDLLAQGAVATMEHLAQERAVHLSVQAREQVQVMGDEARLIQVVLNLVENALVYTNPGGNVTVETGIEQERAILRVRDTGIGIAHEHLPHVFERFYRTDKARSRAAGGTGLGLSIVEWIIHTHGGTIDVQSQPEQGSLFSISLPLARLPGASEGEGDTAKYLEEHVGASKACIKLA
ncbi:HAMP domain-containing sensor histidine kinase [Ktedonobacter racemifer]|uniref:histidine kinase n=1 Tax=Ktedonobacter racemifer DSM 44963 TaxID=485913 RepID=D6TUH8_KTERA|nr:HAMP domain-containing sensor histidine kinase [Ktedonobacter racemifer]EFH84046.1 integral membrane sensor signal transduction histidine kinase [Ktedonobacter racemifer DSM 44963]